MGFFNASIFLFTSVSSLGKKRFLRNKKNKIMIQEIITVASACFGMTMFGLGLGFLFLQVQNKS